MVFTTLLFITNQIINTVNLTIRLFTFSLEFARRIQIIWMWIRLIQKVEIFSSSSRIERHMAQTVEYGSSKHIFFFNWRIQIPASLFNLHFSFRSSCLYKYYTTKNVYLKSKSFLCSNIYMFFIHQNLNLNEVLTVGCEKKRYR